jgi:hypothetical protein
LDFRFFLMHRTGKTAFFAPAGGPGPRTGIPCRDHVKSAWGLF